MIDTINLINKQIAKQLNIQESVVKSVNGYYWSHIRSAIQSGDHTCIRIKNIGTLVTSKRKLSNQILWCIRKIRSTRAPGRVFKSKSKEDYLVELYEKLRKMLKRRNELAVLYKQSYDKYKLRKTSVGEQITDNAGSSIEDILNQED